MGPEEWCPLDLCNENVDTKIALMLLNTPLNNEVHRLKIFWKKALLKAAVDGAANQLYSCKQLPRADYKPDIISGDFDSISSEILDYYRKQGSDVIHTPDENAIDFFKCLKVVHKKLCEDGITVDAVVAYGEVAGRLDHMMANINTLCLGQRLMHCPIYLAGASSFSCLLAAGKHRIHLPSTEKVTWCGLIPIGQPCHHVTTTGLKWNLNDQSTFFGDLVSTSNEPSDAGLVTVETDGPLLWTMGS